MPSKAKDAVTKKELKRLALEACKNSKGQILPDAVIKAARNPKSILHGEFEWDVNKAAHATWVRTACELIREHRFTVIHEEVRISAPYYVSDPAFGDTAYIDTIRLAKRDSAAKQTLADEIARIKGAVRRALGLAVAFNLVGHFEDLLRAAVDIERTLLESSNENEEIAVAEAAE